MSAPLMAAVHTLTVAENLPKELCDMIWSQIMQPWIIRAQKPEPEDTGIVHIDWRPFSEPPCSDPPTPLDIHITAACRKLVSLAWPTAEKTFRSSHEFAIAHYYLKPPLDSPLLRLEPWASLKAINAPCVISPLIPAQNATNSKHGLEKIRLDLSAHDYFALFAVTLPPFDDAAGLLFDPAELEVDRFSHFAARFLKYTEQLTLNFGSNYKYMTPWDQLDNDVWKARGRPTACESGRHVDWILSFAWANQYLQHIPSIKITGDVQEWVKAKWHNIFARHAAYKAEQTRLASPIDPFAVYDPDILAIQEIGRVAGVVWEPKDYYPYPCDCQIGCWRLKNGTVEPDNPDATTWEDYEDGELKVTEYKDFLGKNPGKSS